MSAAIVVAQALNEVLRAPQSLAWDDLTPQAQRAFLADAERIVDALNAAGYLTPAQDALDFGEAVG